MTENGTFNDKNTDILFNCTPTKRMVDKNIQLEQQAIQQNQILIVDDDAFSIFSLKSII